AGVEAEGPTAPLRLQWPAHVVERPGEAGPPALEADEDAGAPDRLPVPDLMIGLDQQHARAVDAVQLDAGVTDEPVWRHHLPLRTDTDLGEPDQTGPGLVRRIERAQPGAQIVETGNRAAPGSRSSHQRHAPGDHRPDHERG